MLFRALAILFALFFTHALIYSADSDIAYNTLGYKPIMSKKASVNVACADFQVKRASDDTNAFAGTALGPLSASDSGRNVYVLDFSSLSEEGTFYINVDGVGRTQNFIISETAYNNAFSNAFTAMYMWRSGTDINRTYGSTTYSWAAGHTAGTDLTYVSAYKFSSDGTGGWYDAGDYGRYVGNAGITIWPMLMAWNDFGDTINAISYNLPETAPGYPEYLKEIKYETDWLFKMMYEDNSGKISDKLTSKNHAAFTRPSSDTSVMYFLPWSTYATANFAGIMAMAARYFYPYDEAYARQCLDAAKLAFGALQANPSAVSCEAASLGFSTGVYDGNDTANRMWAGAELYATTGESVYRTYFEARAGGGAFSNVYDWNETSPMALFTYYFTTQTAKNSTLVNNIRNNTVSIANGIVNQVNSHGYGRSMTSHWWGSNGVVLRMTTILHAAFKMTGDYKYRYAASDIITHMLGRNHFGRSFVTGTGLNPPLYPHDRRIASDGIAAPIPGYIVGGSNGGNWGDSVLSAMPSGLPAASYWADNQSSYASNETAINWQAALIYSLASLLNDGPAPTATPSSTNTPFVTATPTRTITQTRTPTSTRTATRTATPSSTITQTHTVTPFVTATPTMTVTPSPTITQTATASPTAIAKTVKLGVNYPVPNPGKGDSINIMYEIRSGYAKTVTITFYTFGDRKIGQVKDRDKAAGVYQLNFKPSNKLANGLYYYNIEVINGSRKDSHMGAAIVIK